VDELTTARLRVLIEKVLRDPIYRARADYFRKVISRTRGLDVAADSIEQAFRGITEFSSEFRAISMGGNIQ
jgi:UDP:flavonoid glycosyltransferase YjiC (YdhE family)